MLEKLETFSFIKVKDAVQSEDLDVSLKGGLIIRSSFGSLVALREQFKRLKIDVVYFTISSAPLYLVHWNDLSEKKQEDILKKREENERETQNSL